MCALCQVRPSFISTASRPCSIYMYVFTSLWRYFPHLEGKYTLSELFTYTNFTFTPVNFNNLSYKFEHASQNIPEFDFSQLLHQVCMLHFIILKYFTKYYYMVCCMHIMVLEQPPIWKCQSRVDLQFTYSILDPYNSPMGRL